MRLIKEMVFHKGLLKHQLFSENPPKMEFFVLEIFQISLGCQTWFYLFLKLIMGYF